jgi:LPS-assembly protein
VQREGNRLRGALSANPDAVRARRNLVTTGQRKLGHTVIYRTLYTVIVCVMALGGPWLAEARAQDSENRLLDTIVTSPKGQAPVVPANNPMLLQADELVYDNANNRVVARGNVEIYYNNYALTADQVIYDKSANTLAAQGNVRIKEPSGSVINADQITLTEDFRDGFIGSLQVTTQDDVRIAAESASRQDAETTIFENGVFTPCKACKDNPAAPPFWSIKAKRIISKKSEGNLYFEDVSFDLFGQPLVYVPFFYAPDPSVKRRSGFLIPNAGYSEDLGFTSEVPYFWAIAPNMDFTFSPRAMTNKGLLVKGVWRQRLANGAYFVDLAGIEELNRSDLSPTDSNFRGSVVTEGDFALNNWWNFGWNATVESDDTFRRFYKLDNVLTTDRVSNIHLVGQSARNYFGAYAYQFGGLLLTDNQDAASSALPEVDYHYVFDTPLFGGELSFDANALSLSRSTFDTTTAARLTGRQHNRLVAEVKWRKQVIDPIGQMFTPFATAHADVYQLQDVAEIGTIEESRTVSRSTGAVGLQYQFPFAARAGAATHVLEPIAQIIARPEKQANADIPNEDAQSLVFDDTLLFDLDKFSGYDQIETGTRANVGFQYTLQADNGAYARAVIGQSYDLGGDNPFQSGTGLDELSSDYVVGLYMAPSSNLDFVAQSRFDATTLALVREDLSMAYRIGPLAGALNYAFDASSDQLGNRRDSQEIQTSGSLKLTENWTALAALRYDIDASQVISDSLGLKWNNDCTSLSVIYSDTRVTDQDVEANQSIMVRLELDYLGSTSVSSDTLGNFANENRQ